MSKDSITRTQGVKSAESNRVGVGFCLLPEIDHRIVKAGLNHDNDHDAQLLRYGSNIRYRPGVMEENK